MTTVAQRTTDPYSALEFVELSHEWGHGVPSMPGTPDVVMYRSVKHAQHGVMATRLKMGMHTGTHMNAPIHLVQRGIDMANVPLDRFFGNGVILSIPKARWELIEPVEFEAASPAIQSGDFVVVVTGWHHRYSDSLKYFGESPGLSEAAADWLVAKGISVFAIDTPQVDHPLATSLGAHRGGPIMNRLPAHFQQETGLEPATTHSNWNGAHKKLLAAGIPTIEQVGGDVDSVLGQRATFHAAPWKGRSLDACPVRFVAIFDPAGESRIEPGSNS
ncbi:cyclase (plasmid) [Rhizobium sp. ACO-34A]|nr:cyclase family protein [Rhizobium sp. ACO-34A]ATN36947.1 cyclase [Rhizobium sp. ACO-34A]